MNLNFQYTKAQINSFMYDNEDEESTTNVINNIELGTDYVKTRSLTHRSEEEETIKDDADNDF